MQCRHIVLQDLHRPLMKGLFLRQFIALSTVMDDGTQPLKGAAPDGFLPADRYASEPEILEQEDTQPRLPCICPMHAKTQCDGARTIIFPPYRLGRKER